MDKSYEIIEQDGQEISYEACRDLWENENTLVHHDTSQKMVEATASFICKACDLNENDNVLTIGCGDGLFDGEISKRVKTLYGIDFSNQKLDVAKKRNPQVIYAQHNFLERFSNNFYSAGINKIYSYSVMQYCKPKDLALFIENQLDLCANKGQYLIAHLDVPDINKAIYYYSRHNPEITEKMLEGKIKTLFGDGSYWHDMAQVKQICSDLGVECEIRDAHYWAYRSDIIIRIKR